MATTSAKPPSSGTSVSSAPWSDNAWTTPGNVTADDGSTANITAATYDSPDQSHILRVTGFDFSAIPDGSTIDGIVVVINAWYANGTNSGDLAILYDGLNTVEIGNNKWSTPQALTTTNTDTYTLGGSTDKWGATLTAAIVKDSGFGIDLGFAATGANSDVFVDYVSMEVYYTAPSVATGSLAAQESGSDTAALSGNVLVQGSLAAQETGSDTAAVSGLVLVQGALTAQEAGDDTAAITGLVLIQGSLAAQESGADTLLIAGSTGAGIPARKRVIMIG